MVSPKNSQTLLAFIRLRTLKAKQMIESYIDLAKVLVAQRTIV
jgi:hypothetical protein